MAFRSISLQTLEFDTSKQWALLSLLVHMQIYVNDEYLIRGPPADDSCRAQVLLHCALVPCCKLLSLVTSVYSQDISANANTILLATCKLSAKLSSDVASNGHKILAVRACHVMSVVMPS